MEFPPAFLRRFNYAKEGFKANVCAQVDDLFDSFLDQLQSGVYGDFTVNQPNGHVSGGHNSHAGFNGVTHPEMNGYHHYANGNNEDEEEEEMLHSGASTSGAAGGHYYAVKDEIIDPNDADPLFEANFDENEDVINCDCEDCLDGGDGHHLSTAPATAAAAAGHDYRYVLDTDHQVNYDDANEYDNEGDEQVEDEQEEEEGEEVVCKVDPHLLLSPKEPSMGFKGQQSPTMNSNPHQLCHSKRPLRSSVTKPKAVASPLNSSVNGKGAIKSAQSKNSQPSGISISGRHSISLSRASSSATKKVTPARHRSISGTSGNSNSKRKNACQYCGKTFLTHQHCVVHERIHTGERMYKCMWRGCTRNAAIQKENIIRHIRSVHFKLPDTLKKQHEQGIKDARDPMDYVGLLKD